MTKVDPYIGEAFSVGRMKKFDQLSPKEREKANYSPNSIQTHLSYADTLQANAAWDFGPDHPQAKGEFLWLLRK